MINIRSYFRKQHYIKVDRPSNSSIYNYEGLFADLIASRASGRRVVCVLWRVVKGYPCVL